LTGIKNNRIFAAASATKPKRETGSDFRFRKQKSESLEKVKNYKSQSREMKARSS